MLSSSAASPACSCRYVASLLVNGGAEAPSLRADFCFFSLLSTLLAGVSSPLLNLTTPTTKFLTYVWVQ